MFKLKKVAIVLAMAVAAAGITVAVTPSAAQAGTSGTEIRRAGRVIELEVPGWSTASGTGLDLWEPNSGSSSRWAAGANQKWSLPTDGHGGIDRATGYIQNEYSHMCITTDGIQGHAVYQAPCNGTLSQEWNFQGYNFWDWGSWDLVYYFHIVNTGSGLALNASGDGTYNGTPIIVWPLTGQNTDDNEAWGIFL